ncbi:unnamed protein product, partial [Ixodes pacificus]
MLILCSQRWWLLDAKPSPLFPLEPGPGVRVHGGAGGGRAPNGQGAGAVGERQDLALLPPGAVPHRGVRLGRPLGRRGRRRRRRLPGLLGDPVREVPPRPGGLPGQDCDHGGGGAHRGPAPGRHKRGGGAPGFGGDQRGSGGST